MTQPTFRDVELLSAYLDGRLPQADSTRLEGRLASDPELASIYQDLSQARSLLRRLPPRRAPRNFTLSPKRTSVRPPLPRAYPVLRLASGLAAVLFFITTLLGNVPGLSALPAAQAPGVGGAAVADTARVLESSPATEAPTDMTALAPELPEGTATPEMGIAAAPTEPPVAVPPTETVAAPSAPIAGWQAALLGLALVLGGSAFFIRWRTDRKFREKDKGTNSGR